jgi:Zn-dependent protease/CBS domain-containing protein
MSWSFKLFTIKGIPIRVHVTFVLILLWGAIYFGAISNDGTKGALFGVVATLLLFLCVTLHEFGHAIQARAYGIPVEDITLYPIGGVSRLGRIPEIPAEEFRITIAGPLVNVAIAVLLIVFGWIIDEPALRWPGDLYDDLRDPEWHYLLPYLTYANIALAVFNLLPAFPLDGGRIFRALLAMRMDYRRATQIAVAVGQAMALLFGLVGFLSGNFFLILIAVFIWIGGGGEGQQATTRQILGSTPVGAAMIRQPAMLGPEDPLQRAVDLILSTAQSEFPVVDQSGRTVGLLTLGNLVEGLSRNPQANVADIMQRDFPTAQPEERIVDVQDRLGERGARALPVVDPTGRLVGLLTMNDVGEVIRVLAARPSTSNGSNEPHATGQPVVRG